MTDNHQPPRKRRAPSIGMDRPVLTDAHLQALQEGRDAGRAVAHYLSLLARKTDSPRRRGRRRTLESVQRQLTAAEQQLAAGPRGGVIAELNLRALIHTLTAERRRMEQIQAVADFGEAEKGFVEVAGRYAKAKKIHYDVWRKMGVPAETLRAAGIVKR